MRRRHASFLHKSSGVLMAVAGLFLIVKTVPVYLWPLLLGVLLIWLGWRLYAWSH